MFLFLFYTIFLIFYYLLLIFFTVCIFLFIKNYNDYLMFFYECVSHCFVFGFFCFFSYDLTFILFFFVWSGPILISYEEFRHSLLITFNHIKEVVTFKDRQLKRNGFRDSSSSKHQFLTSFEVSLAEWKKYFYKYKLYKQDFSLKVF